MGEGESINQKVAIYKQLITLNIQLNNKAAGSTKLCTIQRMIGLLRTV